MKLICIILLAGLSAAAAVKPRVNPFAGQPREIKAGAKLYHRHCAACHEAGGKAPPLSPASTGLTTGELFRLLKDGRLARGMPSWAQLPPEQRWQIISWLTAAGPY